MGGFCKHCGKELNGDEPYCPDCGMPTGSVPTRASPAARPKNNNLAVGIAVVSVIAILCIIGIILLPSMIDVNNDKYTVTVTVDSFRIDVIDDEHQYNGPLTRGEAVLNFVCSDGSSTITKELSLDENYQINTDGTNIFENKFTFNYTGEPKDLKFTVFLYYYVSDGTYVIGDIIDIYTVSPAPTGVKYVGDTGIAFTLDEVVDGKIELKGDSDPIGTVNLTITSVKL